MKSSTGVEWLLSVICHIELLIIWTPSSCFYSLYHPGWYSCSLLSESPLGNLQALRWKNDCSAIFCVKFWLPSSTAAPSTASPLLFYCSSPVCHISPSNGLPSLGNSLSPDASPASYLHVGEWGSCCCPEALRRLPVSRGMSAVFFCKFWPYRDIFVHNVRWRPEWMHLYRVKVDDFYDCFLVHKTAFALELGLHYQARYVFRRLLRVTLLILLFGVQLGLEEISQDHS